MAQQLKDLKFTDSVATPSSVASQITEQVAPMISCAVSGKRDKSDTSFAQVNVVCTTYRDTGICTPDAAYKYDQSDNGIARLVDVKAVQIWASTQYSGLVGVTDRLSSQKQDKLTAGENVCINGSVISVGAAAVDTGLDSTSLNPVQNKVVTAALEGKQDKLTIATTVASGDGNPVSGGAVHTALQRKQDTLTAGDNITITDNVISATGGGGGGGGSVTVDDTLSDTSTNPIQNQWLGKRMGATENNSVQIGYNANAGTTSSGDNGYQVAVGREADGTDYGTAVGYNAIGAFCAAAVGYNANGYHSGAALGYNADGASYGTAVGYDAQGYDCGAAVGYNANGSNYGVAVGREANTNSVQGAVAVGYEAVANSNTPIVIGGSQFASSAQITVSKTGVLKVGGKEISGGGSVTVDNTLSNSSTNPIQNQWLGKRMGATETNSVEIGYCAKAGKTNHQKIDGTGGDNGYQVAVGRNANGSNYGTAVGNNANGYNSGAAVGYGANGYNNGAAVGYSAYGYDCGAAVGRGAQGHTCGVAVGYFATGSNYGAALGYSAKTNSVQGAVAVGYNAVANSNTPIVIGGSQFASTARITVSSDGVLKVGGSEVAMASDIPDTSGFALASDVDAAIGDINSILETV